MHRRAEPRIRRIAGDRTSPTATVSAKAVSVEEAGASAQSLEALAPLALRGRGKPTMTDVARIAGVSQTSVSLILNRMAGARIADGTRERVMTAALQIGYELPSARARFLSPSGGNVVAYLIDEISTSPHGVVTLDGARDACWESGLLVATHVTRSNPDLEAATLDSIRRDPSVIGVIYSTIFTRRVTPPAGLLDLPTVLLNCHGGDRRLNAIIPGEVKGGFTATRYLLSKGHRRIGFINGEPWMEASSDRLKGYRQALAASEIPFDAELVRNGDWLPLQGYQRTLELLRLTERPSAIFCANDLMAMGALQAARECGHRVPDDISVMGYDDQELARYTDPPLSTLVLANYEMGRKAAELLINIAAHRKTSRPVTIRIDGPLVERASVAQHRSH
jgi:LacI family transcriptional regulator